MPSANNPQPNKIRATLPVELIVEKIEITFSEPAAAVASVTIQHPAFSAAGIEVHRIGINAKIVEILIREVEHRITEHGLVDPLDELLNGEPPSDA